MNLTTPHQLSPASVRIELVDHIWQMHQGQQAWHWEALGNDTWYCATSLADCAPNLLHSLIHTLFAQHPQHPCVFLQIQAPDTWLTAIIRLGIASSYTSTEQGVRLRIERGQYWQHPAPWLTSTPSSHTALHYVMSPSGRRHPRRPAKPTGVVYQRILPQTQQVLSFRTVDPHSDVQCFHAWMNQERVDFFWEEKGTLEQHLAYLQKGQADPHTHPLMACLDGQPFAYIEAYWCKEDRIAPFYDVADYDRGMHLLAGDTAQQTGLAATVWLKSLFHYLFLDDVRTMRLIGEPRVDNQKMIQLAQSVGAGKYKEFDFPHKRAALMVIEREAFFDQYGVWN